MAVMSHRTTVVLDDDSLEALRQIAARLGVSASEVVRRAVVRFRDERIGVSEEKRQRRGKALRSLIERMDGQDVDAELARLDVEDEPE